MFILTQTNGEDIARFGRQLLNVNRDSSICFEVASRQVTKAIFDEFRQPSNDPLFALVRIFRFAPYNELTTELQSLASSDVQQWLALMSSTGVEWDWCDRHRSQGHRAIPADSPATPMLKAAFEQIGLRFGGENNGNILEMHTHESAGWIKHFHVPVAIDSPYVPDQEQFVIPYNIKSVVGIGSPFSDGTAYMLISFSLSTIDTKNAEKFAILNPYIGTLLASFKHDQIWDS